MIVWGDQTLLASNLSGLVIHKDLVPFELGTGENGLALPSVGKLVQDDDDTSSLGFDHSTSGDNRNVGESVVVNPLDVHLSSCLADHSHIIASNSTIGSSVDQGIWAVSLVGRGLTDDAMLVDETV